MKRIVLYSTMLMAVGVVLAACDMGPGAGAPTPLPDIESTGGLRLVLEALGLPGPDGSADRVGVEQLEAARDIVKKRLEIMELVTARVEISGTSGLSVKIPGSANVEEVKQILTQRGLIEFLDGGSNPVEPGVYIVTEAGGPFPEKLLTDSSGVVYPVVLNSDDLLPDGVSVMNESGTAAVHLKLTDAGKTKLADFTGAHVGGYMPMALDKRVLFSPVIRDAITGGTAAIAGIGDSEIKSVVACVGSGVLPVYLAVASEEVVQPK